MFASLKQILRNNVKEKLARDEVVASMTVRLVRNVEIARIAATCGFDTIYVDVEHSTFSLDTTSQICVAALDAGITPFVRVPSHGAEYVGRASSPRISTRRPKRPRWCVAPNTRRWASGRPAGRWRSTSSATSPCLKPTPRRTRRRWSSP
jgi:hypothetical protein